MSEEKKQLTFPAIWKKPLSWIFTIIIILLTYSAYILFVPNISPNSPSEGYIYIKDGCQVNDVIDNIEKHTKVNNTGALKQAAMLLRYTKVKPGKYEIHWGMNNFTLIRNLRSGRQVPVKLSFNNIRTKQQLAARLSEQLMADSTSIIQLLDDTAFLAKRQLTPETAIALFIPNTYEIYWNTTALQLFERMEHEYSKFWTPKRKALADSIPFTPVEVITLASIVEEETNNKADRPMVAGLYINRLKQDMPLQADPTVKFAVGDFGLRRILLEHLRVKSPYNTYKNNGLPPGPIRVTSPAAIDAVLHYSKHNYIYMCASETLNGMHKFTSDWTEHCRNAKKYQEELNKRKIFK
jgi:UPF0755 protein